MVGKDIVRDLNGVYRTAVFVTNVLPTIPSLRLNRRSVSSGRRLIVYPAPGGEVEAELFMPGSKGPVPGVVVCLGVVPAGVEHPQVRRLGDALARAGLATLLYWSPAMRDLRLDPGDIEGIAAAYRWLIAQPYVAAERSGLIGTCVGGAFALLAAAQPEIRDRIAFVGAFAPYSSMWTLAREVASRTRPLPHGREPWAVDQLTRRVFVRTLTEHLDPLESTRLRTAYDGAAGRLDPATLSNEARLVQRLLEPLAYERTESALHDLPVELRARLERMSPDRVTAEIHAPCIVLAHDRDDPVIPIGQSRHLAALLGGRAGVRYTEFTMFKHMDPTKVSLGRIALARELLRFGHALHPIFRI